jgi:hypothetical protein
MSFYTVQINFELVVSASQYVEHAESLIPAMRELPGLAWKLWIVSEDGRRAGGLYLFRDRRSAEQYVSGPLVSQLKSSPTVRNVEVRVTPVHEGLSAQTAGVVLAQLAPR